MCLNIRLNTFCFRVSCTITCKKPTELRNFMWIWKLISQPQKRRHYVPISRQTDATCNRFLFSIYMYITLHVSSVKRSLSEVPHHTYSLQFLCLCLSAALFYKKERSSFLQDSAADRHKHRNWRLYVWWGTPDDESLTFETCRVIHI
jgi:hypothetical protein